MIGKVKTLISPCIHSQHTSFLDILRYSTLHQYPSGNQPDPIMCTNDTPWQVMEGEISSLLVGHESQDNLGNGQPMTIEDHVRFEVNGLQAEEDSMLNPIWTLDLHDLAITQNTEASVGTNKFHAGILGSMPHGQDLDWEEPPSEIQQAGHAYLEGTVPAHTNMFGSMLTSAHDVITLSQAQSDTTQRSDTLNNAALSDSTKQLCSLPFPDPAEVPKGTGKRKRIKTVLSRKKQCLTPSRLIHRERSSVSTTDLSSKLAISTESAAKAITNNGTASSKQPSGDHLTEQSRADWMPAWEQGRNRRTNHDNAGIVRDLKISDSERRPMSWPHRSPWRKSLDISVAVLTKGFDRLMTERGESFPSAT